MDFKTCKLCQLDKSVTEFRKNRNTYQSYCKECDGKWHKNRYKDKKDELLENIKEYRRANKEQLYEKYKAWRNHKLKTDSKFIATKRMRDQVSAHFKGKYKPDTTFNLLGYTIDEFLELYGKEIDSFNSVGTKYNIDHRIPIFWFKVETPASLIWDLRNLQIISEEENIAKRHLYPSLTSQDYLNEIRGFIEPEYLCW